jgi:hypothetical protein
MTMVVGRVVALLVVVLSSSARAGDPPTIGVRFTLGHPSWQERFDPRRAEEYDVAPGSKPCLETFERACAAAIAEELADAFPCFAFTTDESAARLSIELSAETGSEASSLANIMYHISLEGGAAGRRPGSPEWVFRSTAQIGESLGDEASFLGKVRDRWRAHLELKGDELLEEVLACVPLRSNVAVFVIHAASKSVCFIPRASEDFRMDVDSMVELEAQMASEPGLQRVRTLAIFDPDPGRFGVPSTFLPGMMAEEHDGDVTLKDLVPDERGGVLTVFGLYVIRYEPMLESTVAIREPDLDVLEGE